MQNYNKFIELLKEHYVRFKPKQSSLHDELMGGGGTALKII